MLFNSYIFIFVYLPVTFLLYYAARRFAPAASNMVLATASLAFYGWWDIRFLPLLVASIAVNFVFGRLIEQANQSKAESRAKLLLTIGIVLNLLTLGFFKYTNFFLANVMAFGGERWEVIQIVLPIGISFFTFQQIAYLVDVRLGISERYRFTDYALFVSFFPQLIAGPIVHHRQMMPQFAAARQSPKSRVHEDIAIGLSIFIAGLFKKVMIADNLAPFATPIFAAADAGAAVTSFEAWGASLAYTFQLYFDFSGYSDMAIGLGRMFGIRLPVNFHSPYKAGSIIEFWRRWHITLSHFLRDYLYIRLGGSRRGKVWTLLNLMATMLLGGLWHGAGWGFVIWGGLHGVYLIINHGYRSIAQRMGVGGRRPWTPVTKLLGWALTFLAVVLAWVFFRAETLEGALVMLHAMFDPGGLTVPGNLRAHLGDVPLWLGLTYGADSVLGLAQWVWVGIPMMGAAAAIAFCLPNTSQIFMSGDAYYAQQLGGQARPDRPARSLPWFAWRPNPAFGMASVFAFFLCVVFASSLSEFLYFQF